jgi:hypothetical protein
MVWKEVADEYNAKRTLTSITASQEQTGPGAYISPALSQWQTNERYYRCMILAYEDKFKAAPKFFIPDDTMRTGQVLNQYLNSAKQNPAKALLFSRIRGSPQLKQLLIPAYYLPQSKVKGTWAWRPDVSLLEASAPTSDWDNLAVTTWHIPGWIPCICGVQFVDFPVPDLDHLPMN